METGRRIHRVPSNVEKLYHVEVYLVEKGTCKRSVDKYRNKNKAMNVIIPPTTL